MRAIMQQQRGSLRFHDMALLALQDVSEAYIVNLFKDANMCAVHAQRVTLMPEDIQMVCRIWLDMVKYLPV